MKYLPWVSLIIAGIIIVKDFLLISGIITAKELSWIGKSDLAWVVIGLSVSVALLAIYQIAAKKG